MDGRYRWALAVGCLWLSLAATPALADLPPGIGSPPSNADRDKLSHLLASGMAAAWNARAAGKPSQAPTVVIGDEFGNGKPPNLFTGRDYLDAKIVGGKIDNPRDGSGIDHGYHVTGISFGSFGNDGSSPGLVTGAFPKRGKLVPIDQHEDGSLLSDPAKFAPAIAAIPGRVVVNTSIGFRECVTSVAGEDAVKWIQKVRELGLEDRVFHTASAGNEGQQGGSALCGSRWSAAATRTDLQDSGGNPVAPLTNTLAVENVLEEANASALGCLSANSNTDGSIAAPGHEVWSFKKNGGAKNANGTSQASPLVAGLATYLWSIAPDLTPQQLSAAIRTNADEPAPCERASAKRLDAYAATLSLDQTGTPSAATWPVRFAILDKNGDGRFDQKDLAAFRPEVKPSLLNTRRDWSRFDLNGDGFTGGLDTSPFDLDRASSTRAGTTILGDVTDGNGAAYDENSVTDADVLCFYAFSPLYTGSETRREQELKKLCQPKSGTVTFDHASASVFAFCGGQEDGEMASEPPEVLDFDETATTSCANSRLTSSITVGPSGMTITATGSGAASGGGMGANGTASLGVNFVVSDSVPWSISGSVTSSSASGDINGSTARVELDDSQTTFLDAGHCSFNNNAHKCGGPPSEPPDSSFSDSGTLPAGSYTLSALANAPNATGSASASWDVQLDIG